MRVLEWFIDGVESAFGFACEMLRVALMLVVVLLLTAEVLYGLYKAATTLAGVV